MRRLIGILLLTCAAACTENKATVLAKRITDRAELIGGPGALGEVGDFLLANDQIRLIVQGEGYSRGFGLYGGGLIDADLVRPQESGNSGGGPGYDHFSELFPAFFLRAMKPSMGGIRISPPSESDDGSAAIIVQGDPADFLFMLTKVNDVVVGEEKTMAFRNEYRLRPGKRYVEITTTVINKSDSAIKLPGEGVNQLTKGVPFIMPVGDVVLFGAGNDIFAEGAGFDMRYTLEALYKNPPAPAPALPGLVTPFVATRGEHVSYGYASAVTDEKVSYVKRANYPNGRVDDLLIPFTYAAFTGAFAAAAPDEIAPKSAFSYTKYFIVGRGDVASIRDVVQQIRSIATGNFSGLVREAVTLAPFPGSSVVTFDASGRPFNQHTPDADGHFIGSYPPGKYSYRVVADGIFTTQPVDFEIVEGKTTFRQIDLPSAGLVSVRVLGEDDQLLPAKCNLVGRYPAAASNFDPKQFLFDYRVGEARRPTDLIPDTEDPATREFIEQTIFAPSGQTLAKVRPGHYRAVCSRGIEYDTDSKEIDVMPGQLASVGASLHHLVDSSGWVSGDYHLHSAKSVDSAFPLESRVGQCAAEGLDIALSSDHNFITDLSPVIGKLNLTRWLQSIVGLELTTLEIGHFNGFPLRYDSGPITKGSFAWAGRAPKDIFSDLRALGSLGPENTVVQVNHPRDSLLGYLTDYNFDPDTGEAEDADSIILAPTGAEFGKDKLSFDFDAMEVFNGKRFELNHSYRVPAVLPPPPLPDNIPPAGTILRNKSGKVAFPGGLEDWYVMLNKGLHITATGNSDSHEGIDEAGYPRTYTPVIGSDMPGLIDESQVAFALKHQQAFVTNGPLIFASIGGKGPGEMVDGKSGSVTLAVDLKMAPWLDVDTITVVMNGENVASRTGDKTSLAHVEIPLTITRDSWVLVEVSGAKSMFPVLTPHEVPPLQIADAVGSLAGTFGISLNPFGNLQPDRVHITHPFGFTNPIYIDFDSDGKFSAIGISKQALRAGNFQDRVAVQNPKRTELPLLVKLFSEFASH